MNDMACHWRCLLKQVHKEVEHANLEGIFMTETFYVVFE